MTFPNNPSATDFEVEYDGPALAQHSIPVRDLAPALLALGQAFERANAIINGSSSAVSLEIKATNQASFEVALTLKQLLDGASGALSRDFLASASDLVEILVGGPVITLGLFGLLKRLKGRAPRVVQSETVVPITSTVAIEIDDTRFIASTRILDLYQDGAMRDYAAAVVRPVSKSGIESLTLKVNKRVAEVIGKADTPAFDAVSTVNDPVTQIVIRQRLRPAQVGFTKNYKWRLNDGERTRLYSIEDSEFIKQVEEGNHRFGSKDLIIADVVMTQSIKPNGDLDLDYTITSVIDHIQPPLQTTMFSSSLGNIDSETL